MAEEVFRFSVTCFSCVLLLAVDESTKVWFLASIAHVERAAVVYVLLRLVVVSVARSG